MDLCIETSFYRTGVLQQKNEDPRTPFLQETDWYWVEMVGIRMYLLLNQLSSGYQLETIHVIPENPCFLTISHLPGCPRRTACCRSGSSKSSSNASSATLSSMWFARSVAFWPREPQVYWHCFVEAIFGVFLASGGSICLTPSLILPWV